MKRVLLGGFILFLSSPLFGSPLERIPTDSWVYPVINRLYAAGLLPQLHRSIRPYTRGEIAEYLLEIRKKEEEGRLTIINWQNWLIEKLEEEFRNELKFLSAKSRLGNVAKINPWGVARLTKINNQPGLGRGQAIISGSWEWNKRFIFQTRAVIDNRGEEDPNFFAHHWKKGLTGMFDRGYVGIELPLFYLTIGRDYFRWGPGEEGLLISGHGPALDFLGFELGKGKLRYSFFTSSLDSIMVSDTAGNFQPANRYISGHRLNFKHPSGWEIGFSEIILYGGIDRKVELFYLNPVLPYYVEQYNHNVDDNSLWNLELAVTAWENKEFYGELLIDDFQYDFVSEPNQIGLTLGARLTDFWGWKGSFWNLEYTRVGSFVYGQQRLWNRYTYQGVGLGHLFGSDFDRWQVNLEYIPHSDITLWLGSEYRRQGEMTPDSVYPNPLPKNIPFPSGVVEKSWSGSAGFRYQPGAHLIGSLNITFQDFKNYRHTAGLKYDSWTLGVRLDYNFWKEFWF